jgi:Na+/melibiose symporter-like transporter
MFEPEQRIRSTTMEAVRRISLHSTGFVIAFISFLIGIVLSEPVAEWLDQTDYYVWGRCALALPVILTLCVMLVLAMAKRHRLMMDVFATLLLLCVLSGIAVACAALSTA